MKLLEEVRFEVEDQLGIDAIHDDHPFAADFKEIFGDHTFFLDEGGLSIVVPEESVAPEMGSMVKVASWTESRDGLWAHDPEILPVVVDLMCGENGA